ncbi:ABC transporter ATP-binding protein [Gordonia hydrophobica]|uniref:ABC transporter ATP-binding protein n=1 Tax=Gordonia hydrophobica TaxID=40516 RepID=A0ABZ2U4W3_9ACTN|nr:ABC transporter ATP-binding protein [Gordonia hydrophobica]MBM7369491.1 iron complex transport system ATP-binding protein [Gordonia hydrophobica]
MTIEVCGVDFSRGDSRILHDINCGARAGEFTGIIGPNGSGKSTLLSLMVRWQQPDRGHVLLNGRDLRHVGRLDFARTVAEVEQHATTVMELTVEQIVELGTIPHTGSWGRPLGESPEEVDGAITMLGLDSLRHRTWHTLSGGERQKTQVARALAQRPTILVLDEPTNHLDIAAGLHLLGQLRRLNLTVIAAIHDLDLAAMFCDRLIVLHNGTVHAIGTPTEVLTPELLAEVYGIDAEVLVHPRTGGPLVVPCTPSHQQTPVRITA